MSARTRSGRLAGPTRTDLRHPDRVQGRLELRGAAPLTGRDQHRQRLLLLLDGKVDLGRQPALGTSEAVVGRLDGDAAGRLLFAVRPFRRTGGVLVGPADGEVDVHVPGDQALRIRLGLEPGDDPGPGVIPLPVAEQVIDPVA
ncbi:hypothetical protein ACFWMJ_41785 [Streptomyces hawaiiensis]|uniref:hypothetical protein n=1 Tax=Streptomyces hawaiiensis TaxID=67305 RepID=UPI00365D8FBF